MAKEKGKRRYRDAARRLGLHDGKRIRKGARKLAKAGKVRFKKIKKMTL